MAAVCPASSGCSPTSALFPCSPRISAARRRRPPPSAEPDRSASRGSHRASSVASAFVYPHQAERLTEVLARAGLDALIATSPANVAYVTGYASPVATASGRFAIFSSHGTALVVPAAELPL